MKNHSLLFTLACCFLFVSSNTFSQEKSIQSSELNSLKSIKSSELNTATSPQTNGYTATGTIGSQTSFQESQIIKDEDEMTPVSNNGEKVFNEDEHLTSLMTSFDQISNSEMKLIRINERMATIPADQINSDQITELITKYNNDRDRAKRKVVSIEHLLKSQSVTVEISSEQFERFSDSVKQHISSTDLYVITK
jgi:hypothetical protein